MSPKPLITSKTSVDSNCSCAIMRAMSNPESLDDIRMRGERIVGEVIRPDGVSVSARFESYEAFGDVPGCVTVELISRRNLGITTITKSVPVYYSGDDVRLIGEGDLIKGSRLLVNAYLNSQISTVVDLWQGGGPLLMDHIRRLGGGQ